MPSDPAVIRGNGRGGGGGAPNCKITAFLLQHLVHLHLQGFRYQLWNRTDLGPVTTDKKACVCDVCMMLLGGGGGGQQSSRMKIHWQS